MMLTMRTNKRFANRAGRNHKAKPSMLKQMHFHRSDLTRVTMRNVQAVRKIRLHRFIPMSSHRKSTFFTPTGADSYGPFCHSVVWVYSLRSPGIRDRADTDSLQADLVKLASKAKAWAN